MSTINYSEFVQATKRELVYVAGPITLGNWMNNLRQAIDVANKIAQLENFTPIIPHTAMIWELIYPQEYTFWLYRVAIPQLLRCKYMIRIPGESSGSEIEVEIAKSNCIPVFFSFDEFRNVVVKN
jgi:hypothetical protein